MSLLKRDNWFICLLLTIVSEGFFYLAIASLMKLYDKDAWYANYRYWLFGFLCLLFPGFIMLIVFTIQMTCKVAQSLKVPGSEIYNTPYTWILCMIIPVVGWSMLIVMFIYIELWSIIMLYRGNGEQYIK